MTSAPSNLPIKNVLSETAYTTSKGKEITYEDLAKCTGTSRSIPARALSRLDVLLRGGGVITDARVKKILEKITQSNDYSGLNKISEQFKDQAKNISSNATHEAYTAKELTADSKNLKGAGDLIKLFTKFQAEKDTKFKTGELAEKAEIAQQKAEDKTWRKEFTEPRELKEINDAKFILSARASLEKKSSLFLLKAAIWENKTQPKNNKEQLSQDFHNFLIKQDPYPTDKEGLNSAYKAFISETLKKTEFFQKNPSNEGAKTHKTKVEDYIRPKTNSLADYVGIMNLHPSLVSVQNGKMSQQSYNTLAQELYNMDERTLLLHIQNESKLDEFGPRLDELKKSLNDYQIQAIQIFASNPKINNLQTEIEKLQVIVYFCGDNLTNYLKDTSLRGNYNFLDLLAHPELNPKSPNALKGENKLNYMIALNDIVKGLNMSETTKHELDVKLTQLQAAIQGKRAEEIEALVEQHNNIFDKAGLEAITLIKQNLNRI
jgi:hypothetical protein